MKEHKQLKEICDKIEYDLHKNGFEIDLNAFGGPEIGRKLGGGIQIQGKRDPREIIFTEEFMDKIVYFCQFNNLCYDEIKKIFKEEKLSKSILFLLTRQAISIGVINNLKNPVEYLYNTLELGKQ